MKDHEIRNLVNILTMTAKKFGQTQQCRDRISRIVLEFLEKHKPSSNSTWDNYEEVDRQGGSFSQSEIDNQNTWR